VRFLLDTNAVIALLEGNRPFINRLRTYQPSDFGMPSIVHHELCFGAYKSKRVAANLQNVHSLQFEVIPISKADAERAAEIRASLQAKGTPIGPYDVLIAGQAVARSLTLITHNVGEFERVESLTLEDWLA
jgi:tRNA(fMet)-specific endonuclease VapC